MRPPESTSPPPSNGGLQSGQSVGGDRYLLKQRLGQGGMGVVWLAFDKRLQEHVALKFLPSQVALDATALNDLRRETLRSRKLSHPHIIRIHDLFEAKDEVPFISMEYVDGPDLHYLRARRPAQVLSWKFLAPVVRQLCAALDYAHSEHVIHRDIKPANLMLDNQGRLKLADFGLACVVHDSMTRLSGHTSTVGTLPYMSPQQADGQKPSLTDDIYAVGATLYELLTSQPPFYTGDISYQIRNNRPQPMQERLLDLELGNEIPSDVSALVMACLAKEPEQRPQSAAIILAWLDASEKGKAAVSFAAPATQSVERPGPSSGMPTAVPVQEASAQAVPPRTPAQPPAAEAQPVPAHGEEFSEPESDRPARPVGGTRLALTIAMIVLSLALVGLGGWYLGAHSKNKKAKAASSQTARKSGRNTALRNSLPPAPPSLPQAVEPDFVSLFNGKDLTGWTGSSLYWQATNGVIAGHVTHTVMRAQRYFLFWAGGDLGEFELRFSFHLGSGSGNMENYPGDYGVYYWLRNQDSSAPMGMEFDIKGGSVATMILHLKEAVPMTLMSGNWSKVYHKEDWNDAVIIARKTSITYTLNGTALTTVQLRPDLQCTPWGGLALEVLHHPSLESRIYFRNIRLKRLGS